MLVNTKDGGSKSTIERDLNNMRSDVEDIDNVDTVILDFLLTVSSVLFQEWLWIMRNCCCQLVVLLKLYQHYQCLLHSTENLVYDLRDYHSQAQEKYDYDTEISGQSVINIDI
jgi:RND superfamily putative drug exporter